MNTENVLKWVRETTTGDLPYNVVGIGWGPKVSNGQETGENCLIFSVEEKKSLEELSPSEIIPQTLSIENIDVKTDVQVLQTYVPCLVNCHSTSPLVEPVKSNRIRSRPLRAGSEGGTWNTLMGTLGTFVVDKNDGQIVGLTNNHVIANQYIAHFREKNASGFTNTSDISAHQPIGTYKTNFTNDYIGKCKIPIVFGGIKIDPFRTTLQAICDASTISLSSYDLINSTSLQPLGFEYPPPYQFATDEEIDSLLNSSSPNYAAPIFKSGRTTGPIGFPGNTFSCSVSVYEFNDVSVGPYLKGYSVYFPNCCKIRGNVIPTMGGDSGSAVYALFDQLNPTLSAWKLVGLIFAGSIDNSTGIFCRIPYIADALNIAPWDGVTIPTLSSKPTYVTTADLNSLTITLSGRTFYQLGGI